MEAPSPIFADDAMIAAGSIRRVARGVSQKSSTARANVKYGFELRSVATGISGKSVDTITALALVVRALAAYLAFETNVRWPAPASSIHDPRDFRISVAIQDTVQTGRNVG